MGGETSIEEILAAALYKANARVIPWGFTRAIR